MLAASLGWSSLWLLSHEGSEPVLGGAPATRLPWSVAAVASMALAHVALAWRRVSPAVSFAGVGLGVFVLLLTSIWWFQPTTLVALVALYSFSAYGRQRAPVIGLTAGVVVATVATVAGFALAGISAGPRDWLVHVAVRLLPFLVAAWSLGMFRRVRLAYIAALEERAERAEAEREERARRLLADERARIAREMHDILAHALSVMLSQANGGRYAAKADPQAAAEALTTIARTGRRALGDMRGLLQVLRTGTRDDDQFPHPALTDLPELFSRVRAAGVAVEFEQLDAPGDGGGVSPAAELAAFRTVQEALTNTLKHAGAGARAQVRFSWAQDGVTITVRDDGVGGAGAPGQGLTGMRERLAVAGGEVAAGPAPGGGFLVEAWLPKAEVDG